MDRVKREYVSDIFDISGDFIKKFEDNGNLNKLVKEFAKYESFGLNEEDAEKINSIVGMFDGDRSNIKFAIECLKAIVNFRNISFIDLFNDDMYIKINDMLDIHTRNFDIVRFNKKYIIFNNSITYVVDDSFNISNGEFIRDDKFTGSKFDERSLFVVKEGTKDILDGRIILKMRLSDHVVNRNQEGINSSPANIPMCILPSLFNDKTTFLVDFVSYDNERFLPYVNDSKKYQFFSEDYPKKFTPIISYIKEIDGMTFKDAFEADIFNNVINKENIINNII